MIQTRIHIQRREHLPVFQGSSAWAVVVVICTGDDEEVVKPHVLVGNVAAMLRWGAFSS